MTMAEQLLLAEKCPPTPQGPLMLQLEQALFPLDADAWCTATAPAPVIHHTINKAVGSATADLI